MLWVRQWDDDIGFITGIAFLAKLIVSAIDDIGMIGNAKAKEEAKEKLARYAPELATVKADLESTQKYIQTLENRLCSSDAVIEGKNAELNAKDIALYEERSKVMQLEYQQKRLIQLLERIPPEMRDELMNGKKTKERQD